MYLVFPVIVIVILAMFTFYLCTKVQDKLCRDCYDYDRKNKIQCPSFNSHKNSMEAFIFSSKILFFCHFEYSPRSFEKSYVRVYDGGDCSSFIGKVGREGQYLSLSPGCYSAGTIGWFHLHLINKRHGSWTRRAWFLVLNISNSSSIIFWTMYT